MAVSIIEAAIFILRKSILVKLMLLTMIKLFAKIFHYKIWLIF
jgi:hypothetical protein